MVESEKFDTEGVIANFGRACENLDKEIPIPPVCNALLEFTKLFGKLGPLGFAFSDVTTKCQLLLSLEKQYADKISGFFSLIELEGQLGIQNLNGENNKSITKDKTLWTYTSGITNPPGRKINILYSFRLENSAQNDVVYGFSCLPLHGNR
jgi:hypothetical protein